MINYEALEPQLEALLAPLVADGCQVRGMPDEPQKKGTPGGDGPVVVHGWFGAIPVGDSSSDGKTQALTNRIVITVRTPTLKGVLGQYQLPGRIQVLLQGAKFPGIGRLDYAGWQMVERNSSGGAGYEGMLVFNLLSM